MRPVLACLAAVVILSGCCGPHSRALPMPPVPDPCYYLWSVYKVVDGDTLEVMAVDGTRIKVRIRGLNAPEVNEPGGAEATARLRAWCDKHPRLRLHPKARDVYGRILATLEAQDGEKFP